MSFNYYPLCFIIIISISLFSCLYSSLLPFPSFIPSSFTQILFQLTFIPIIFPLLPILQSPLYPFISFLLVFFSPPPLTSPVFLLFFFLLLFLHFVICFPFVFFFPSLLLFVHSIFLVPLPCCGDWAWNSRLRNTARRDRCRGESY